MIDADMPRILSGTYSSSIFPEPDVLSTLAVFYDEVWLPYPYGFDPLGVQLWSEVYDPYRKMHNETTMPGAINFPLWADIFDPTEKVSEVRHRWSRLLADWKPLFEHGIFRTLPPPIASAEEVPEDFRQALVMRLGYPAKHGYILAEDLISGKVALALHALYGKKPSPELFVSDVRSPKITGTPNLAGFIVKSLFNIRVPQLNQYLRAEEVLEIRETLKDTKEGFTYYVFKAVDEVEDRLSSSDSPDVEEAALKTVQRNLLCESTEMRRQLEGKKVGFWSNVLAAGATFLQIDASPSLDTQVLWSDHRNLFQSDRQNSRGRGHCSLER